MLPINFKLNGGYYFFPLAADEAAAYVEDGGTRVSTTFGVSTARYFEPAPNYLKFNTNLLFNHIRLSQLLEKKAQLYNTFKATRSEEASTAYEKFMRNVLGIFREILKNCHQLYWLDEVNHIRSALSFEECLERAIDFGYEKLKIMNIITEIIQPIGIASTIINTQLDNKVRDAKKKIGYGKFCYEERF